MAKISYEQARKDHEYLWNIAPAQDMTGAYVDQTDLATLLRNPTKATARDCYCSQIEYWFQAGPDPDGVFGYVNSGPYWHIENDETVWTIAVRHGVIEDDRP